MVRVMYFPSGPGKPSPRQVQHGFSNPWTEQATSLVERHVLATESRTAARGSDAAELQQLVPVLADRLQQGLRPLTAGSGSRGTRWREANG